SKDMRERAIFAGAVPRSITRTMLRAMLTMPGSLALATERCLFGATQPKVALPNSLASTTTGPMATRSGSRLIGATAEPKGFIQAQVLGTETLIQQDTLA